MSRLFRYQLDMPHDDLDERNLPARITSWTYGIALGLVFGWPFGMLFGASGVPLVLFVVASMFVAGNIIRRIVTVVPEGMARAFVYLIWPSGSSTPYEPTYSNEQALAARGDHAGALEAYERRCACAPWILNPGSRRLSCCPGVPHRTRRSGCSSRRAVWQAGIERKSCTQRSG